MITLAFNVVLEGAQGRVTVTVTPTMAGDTPIEREALVQLARETNAPGNVVHRALTKLCEERGLITD